MDADSSVILEPRSEPNFWQLLPLLRAPLSRKPLARENQEFELINQKELIGEFIDAAANDQKRARELLMVHPNLFEARWIHGETVLHFLAVESFVKAVRFLAQLGADVNAPNSCGDPPLIDGASLGNDQVAEILLSFGADPNAASQTRDNVLHCAVHSGNTRLVELLLRAGAKSDYVTDVGHTIFDALPVEQLKHQAVLNFLRKHGVKESAD